MKDSLIANLEMLKQNDVYIVQMVSLPYIKQGDTAFSWGRWATFQSVRFERKYWHIYFKVDITGYHTGLQREDYLLVKITLPESNEQ